MTNWLEEVEENYNIHEQELEKEAYEEKEIKVNVSDVEQLKEGE